MVSFKCKVVNFLIRNRHFFEGKLKREVFDLNTSMKEFRELCEKGAAKRTRIPDEIKIKEESIEDIKSEWIIPEGANSEKLIFYVHGGGYVSGSCNDHRYVVSKLAFDTGITCLQYEYRLAPEHPFPAALEDSLAVYSQVLKKGYKPENIIIMGESAGGGLTLAILLALKQNKIPFPKATVAISPWADLTCSSESYITKNKASVAPKNSWTVFSHHYVGTCNAKNPLISPLFGDLKGLPPIFINSGEADELFDDGRKFYEKAKKADVNVTFKAGKGMIHCYPILAPMFKEATEAMNEILDFIRRQLNY